MLDSGKKTIIESVAVKLRVSNPQWLVDLIGFETGGTFDTQVKNPRSSARGLIQFIDSTARGLGYADSMDLVTKNHDFAQQMKGPVYRYLSKYSPYDAEYKLYMAVFFPRAIRYPQDTSFRKMYTNIYSNPDTASVRYKAFAKANPGIITPRDYVNMVKKKRGIGAKGMGMGMIALAGLALFWAKGKKLLPF